MESTEVERGGALEDLARAHGQELLTFAYLLTRHAALAQDLVQSVLARLAERDLSGIDNLVGYAKRSIVNEVRLHARRGGLLQRLVPKLAPVDEATYVDSSDRIAERLHLWAEMGRLTPVQRAVLVLRYYEDLDDAAVAEVLGCALATVRSHRARGLARLRLLITEEHS